MRLTIRILEWQSPYRQAAYWLLAAICGIVLTLSAGWLGDIFWGGSALMLSVVALAIYGLWIVALGGRAAWVRRQRPIIAVGAACAPFVAIAIGLWCAPPVARAVNGGFTWATLLIKRSTYDEVARLAASGNFPADGWHQTGDVRFNIDSGPPLRLAFQLPGGLLSDWRAIVYDPSGQVLSANYRTAIGRIAAPMDTRALFGGDMTSCDHLTGPYYRCIFS